MWRFSFIIFIFFTKLIYSQGLISDNAVISYSGAVSIRINGNYTSQNGASMMPNTTSTLVIDGNWINNSTNTGFTIDAGRTIFSGNAAQSIGGTTASAFYNVNLTGTGVKSLAVNNTTVCGKTTQTGVLSIGTGTLNLNGNQLNVLNSAVGAITSSTGGYIISETNAAINPSKIRWYVKTTTGAHTFPFGVNGLKIPFVFNITGAMTSATGYVEVSTRATTGSDNMPWAGLSSVPSVTNMYSITLDKDGSSEAVIDRWWDITTSNSTTATVTFGYRGIENTLQAPYNTGSLRAQHWNGSAWDFPVGSAVAVTSGTGAVTVSGLSTFSPWILSALAAPLPIELLNFEAKCRNNKTLLEWCTASEKNNNYFSIEHSTNGYDFIDIASITGNGTTQDKHCYSYISDRNYEGQNYYRLKQTDYDNQSIYSKVIAIEDCGTLNNDIIITNTSRKEVNLLVYAANNFRFDIFIHDALGQIAESKTFEALKGYNTFNLNLTHLNAGLYYVSAVYQNDKINSKKIIISNTEN